MSSSFRSTCLSSLSVVALLAISTVHPMNGQVLYGSVVGTITDQSDAVVPNAAVTLVNRDTGQSKEVVTNESGRYSLVNVLPGRYDLKIVAKGFRAYAQTDIEVSPN